MKKYIYVIELLLSGLLASCGSMEVLTYDQLHPAEFSFPTEIRQVGVVNNMPVRPNAPTQDLILGVVSGEGAATAEAVAGALADSKYFNQVVICDSALEVKDADIAVDPVLSGEEVQTLSTDLGVDMLISMERLWVKTAKTEVLYPGWDVPYPVVLSTVTPVVRLYLPGRTQPFHTVSFSDSLYWDLNAPISEKIVLEEATRMVAAKIADRLVPNWIQAERVYFTGGCVEMRDAAVCLMEGSWQEAQNIWVELYKRLKKGSTKMKAAFNVALSYEMLGNLEEAEKWINLAKKYVKSGSNDERIILLYAEELAARKNELPKLNIQMSRFHDNF